MCGRITQKSPPNQLGLKITTLVEPRIHDRMPVIIPPESYDRWLSTLDPDPRDLLVPYPAGPMMMWPISTRVNKPENDESSILDRVDEPVGIIAE
jgi:putative SOS response-associated peptidase YedK